MNVRFKEDFNEKEWRNKEDPHGKECLKRLKGQGKTHRCVRCRQWFARSEFKASVVHVDRLVCSECKSHVMGFRTCNQCFKEKPEKNYQLHGGIES